MKRVVAHEFGGPEQLTVEPITHVPVPRPGELLVDVEAAGINYFDLYQRKGLRKLPLPFTPGLDPRMVPAPNSSTPHGPRSLPAPPTKGP